MQDRNVENINIRQNVKTRDGTQHTAQVKHILSIQNHECWVGVEIFRMFGSEVGDTFQRTTLGKSIHQNRQQKMFSSLRSRDVHECA